MVSVGEELTLQLGFCALMDYTSTPYPAAGAALHYLKEDGSVGDQTEWTTDENGQVKVSFDAAGTYYLTCSGTVSYYDAMWGMDNQGTLSPAYCKVTVTAGTEEPPVEPEPTAYTVTLPSGDGYTVTAREGSSSPVTEGGSYSFSVTLAEGYQTGEDFTVKANDAVLTAVDGVYTIENITADQTISVGGVVKQETEEVPTPDWQEVMAKTQAYLTAQANNEAPGVGSAYGEWMVLGLARAGLPISTAFFQTYYNTVVQYVKDHIDESGRLDDGKSTENSRLILALTALGKDVTLVGGHDLLQGLSDTEHVTKQGINGPIWALIALDSHDYTIPVDAEITRDWLVEDILSKELPGGGWGMSQIPDDMTGMAVQALAPYYNNREDVKAAVDRAIPVMENMIPHVSVENLAQMVVALSALGVDSGTETLEAALTQLLTFAEEDGSFRFGSGSNQMATEQAFYALVAYDRFRSGKTALYDMSDVTIEESTPDTPDNPGTPSQPNPPAETPEFGLSKDEIDGYVYVSFEDKGVRVAGDEGTYPKALGTILKKTRVPYTQGDTIADVTLRALDAYDFTYSHTGTTKSNFYLSSIGSFTVKGIDYDSFGEFDAGTGSGWMITWDGVFINKGASEFQVENGDVIRWQYTCQLGADIGDDGSAVGGGNQTPQVPPEVLPEEPPVTSSPYT
ncbi:MAG: DUF4430 domain-containing protein, partial [Ruminiclostridium sp.]|nr:DUF4430 domain-containing protein [Ruminiclostridium sp.]